MGVKSRAQEVRRLFLCLWTCTWPMHGAALRRESQAGLWRLSSALRPQTSPPSPSTICAMTSRIARAAGWSLEEVAYYLGHVTKKGTPAIQTTARYTQVSRGQVKAKLRHLRG